MKALFWIAVIIITLPIFRYVMMNIQANRAKTEEVKQETIENDLGTNQQQK